MMEQTKNDGDVCFDDFLIEKWGDSREPDYEKRRRNACREFRKKIKGKNVAASATVNSWFGIGGKSQPNRDKMYCLAFALQLSGSEFEEYLKRGLLMPGIQVNDYKELICFYGLEHRLSFQECQQMIDAFESYLCQDLVIEQRTHTVKLWEFYGKWRKMDKVHFLKEMYRNASMFKGYSKTSLKYFESLKKEILHTIFSESQYHLKENLKKAGYDHWVQKEGIKNRESKEEIYRYLKNLSRRAGVKKDRNMSALISDIRRDCRVIFAPEQRNVDLLRELFSSAIDVDFQGNRKNISYLPRKEYALPKDVRFMRGDYLSNLMNVALQKEKQIRLSHAQAWSRHQDPEETCPAWLEDMLQDYHGSKVQNIGQAMKLLDRLAARQAKRCLLIQREDLLPLIHCAVQKKYMSVSGQIQKTYQAEMARKTFEEMANCILMDCDMEVLSRKYSLDRLLLESFREEGIDTYADIIDSGRM